jgi:glycerophosphoryl diester phosphodiesterase
MWSDLQAPFVVAHRGDEVCAPENTLSAFRQAVEKGADAVEFDVKLTADGQVVVIHDQTVDRTTNGTGNVAKFRLKALQELDAGVQFPGQFTGERIPTLEEVFETVGKHAYMNIELKNYATPFDSLVPKVAQIVKKHGMQEQVLFSSFLAINLRKARLLLPEVPQGLLVIPGWKGSWGRTFGWRGNYNALNPKKDEINASLVYRVHAAGKRVIAWTINTEAEFKRMIGLGVDGIITGDLALVLNMLGRHK